MPTTEQLRTKLINKLKELFQLNQPDLDFGFYRIMHAKSEQVSSFIENDLLHVIQDTFGQADETKKDKLKQELDNAIQTAIDFGAPDPETTPKVMEARAKYDAIKDSASSEAEIYDHLYRFFERYYDDGDFISRRYYTRETPGKAAPFAVPYNGEEVKLHWANADQYYIKTTEYFSNFSVNLSEALKKLKDGKKNDIEELDFADSTIPEGLKVHFSIVDATEGDHANVKASDATKRYFIIHKEKPIELNDKNELIINFEYKPTMEKTRQETLNQEAVALVIKSIKDFEPRNSRKDTKNDLQDDLSCDFVPFVVEDYLNALSTCIPTEKDKDRILLTKYINQYTARNTMDYFIHKNLGAFLKRELDFYIKNEIMRLDDIENAEAPKVEDYLAKIKVLRKIAIKLIDFMAQLEDFQKKLWLKKKFVVETNYCITLDRVPEELYPQIIENKEQIDEWIKLYAIDEIEGDTTCPAYTNPLTINFLKVNDKLMLDTRFFDKAFKAKLLSSIQGFDDQCDGLLIHSENFQALNMLQERFREQVNGIFIDPPYNTGDDGFVYKDSYPSSTWLTMINERLDPGMITLTSQGALFASIGDEELEHLSTLIREKYDKSTFFSTLVWEKKKKGSFLSGQIAKMKDYVVCVAKDMNNFAGLIGEITTESETYPCVNASNPRDIRIIPQGIESKYREKNYSLNKGAVISAGNMNLVLVSDLIIRNGRLAEDLIIEGNWRYSQDSMLKYAAEGTLYITQDLYLRRIVNEPREKRMRDILFRLGNDNEAQYNQYDINNLGKYGWGTNEDANDELHQILGEQYAVSYPKPSKLILQLFASLRFPDGYWVDYFSGSGTTGHAVINLNREDSGKRKYILVEMGNYFDTVLKPRIQKVVYSKDWKDGKPVSKVEPRKTRKATKDDLQAEISCDFEPFVVDKYGGISHCFKYLRLESYEDTLNNLVLQNDPIRDKALASSASLQEDYMLHYLLDVESKGSQSLLNIDAFDDPTSYVLKVKKPGSDEYIEKAVDLIETFNYLIGLRLVHLGIPQTLTAAFTRMKDPDLPQDQDTKLIINGDFKQAADGKWWIRKVEGWVPKNPYSPNDGLREKVLIVWRKLTGNLEEDNLILDAWFTKNRISTLDWEFDTIYVNGSNNLPNLQKDGDTWKVRLIEEEFMKRMWEQN
ncbi:MAG: site-specific DNA-methyltransferase [Candidatus Cloacimonetes bacterium]|nr:site-specific DNA-methyltransferase [Candidatus Cloacimonadota bacterium]